MIGIVIGVLSVILMLSIGEAAQRYILAQISSFGSDVIFIQNGAPEESGQPTLFIKQSLTMKDVRKLASSSWVSLVVGKLNQQDQVTGNGVDMNVQVVGTMSDDTQLNDLRVLQGTFITAASVDSHAREAVLGYTVAKTMFGVDDAMGKTVKINGSGFRVVGVMAEQGTKGFQDVDKQVYVPVSSALDLYNKQYLTFITVKTTLPLAEAKERLRIVMRERHNIDNPAGILSKDDFNVQTQEDLVKSASTITDILQILLVAIAAISLLVGGIGIMNIMYVSVTERTKEIGLRKSIGARERDILRQFLFEAVVQTLLGGLIGTVLGLACSWLAVNIINNFQPGWTFVPSTRGMLLGVSVSGLIGVLFGYFPARRAARLHPIDALRFE
jgi:putative ABC transport system permease protein